MIGVIDYGIGNCGSIINMLRFLGAKAEIIDNPKKLDGAHAIVLSGVGTFDAGMSNLSHFRSALDKKVMRERVPILGICLGMQLFFGKSDEGASDGLGWLDGRIAKFDFSKIEGGQRYNVPHMGWNSVFTRTLEGILRNPIGSDRPSRYYFVHSYHAIDVNPCDIIGECEYGYRFTCAVQNENIYGVQFHPEKSHVYGKQLFQNFIDITKC